MFDNVTNKDDARRQEIITEHGGNIMTKYVSEDGRYDILPYDNLTGDALDTLIKEGFADEDEQQNSCPCIREINAFLHAHPNFTAHGYIVTPERSDYRVSIEGVSGTECCLEDTEDFIRLFRRADDFTINGDECYCWFD